MKRLGDFLIDVDYHPCDPGNTTWYCERTRIPREGLVPGKPLHYDDPGNLFGAIRVLEVSDDALVIAYGDETYTLDREHASFLLDEDGRDYTEFELRVFARFAIPVENTPGFFRRYAARNEVAQLTPTDIDYLKDSDDPCAKYLLGRWYTITAPEDEASAGIAEGLYREAAEAGIADALDSLAVLYALGATAEDRVDLPEAERLWNKAIEMGSETALLRRMRHRICGIWLAPEEPEAVLEEIGERIQADAGLDPEWYSVLGYAYDVLGRDDAAEEAYRTGIEKGCVRCYGELAFWYKERGKVEEYRRWMEAGMEKGCGICFLLDNDYPEDAFEKLGDTDKARLADRVRARLEKGLALGEGACAYWLGFNYYYGCLGFPKDAEKGSRYLAKGIDMGDGFSCVSVAEILDCDPDDVDREIAAKLRLTALRAGIDTEKENVIQAYRDGLLDDYKEEIEEYWLEDDDYEDDRGQWDAYV
jgi:TPR repeat protein